VVDHGRQRRDLGQLVTGELGEQSDHAGL
jgi:hypothetical protein